MGHAHARTLDEYDARVAEYRSLARQHTAAERKLTALLNELRNSMPSERAEIRADIHVQRELIARLERDMQATGYGRWV